MKLVVTNAVGDTTILQILPDETFVELKKRVERKAGISLNLKDIMTNGKILTESQKVIEYFIYGNEIQDVSCCVPGCGNTKKSNADKVFFDFPQEDIRCHQWVLYCQRLSLLTGKHRMHLTHQSSICSDHFRPEQFVKNTTTLLKRTAVPCINPELPVAETWKCSTVQRIRPARPEDAPIDGLYCRLCAKTCNDSIFVFSKEGRRLKIAEMINSVLPIAIKMTDDLPKQVCSPCIEQLNSLTYLIKRSLISQNKLENSAYEEIENSVILTDGNNVTLGPTEHCCPLCGDGTLLIAKTETLKTDQEEEIEDQRSNCDKSESNCLETDVAEMKQCKVECCFCDEELCEFASIIEHSDVHKEGELYNCVICKERCTPYATLVEHLLTHKQSSGGESSQGISNEENPTSPSPSTGSTSGIKCNVCSKKYRSESRLKMHMRLHSASPTSCESCGKVFPDEMKLHKHSLQTHGDERNKCDDCGKVFSTVSSLRFHEKSHQRTNCKPYNCEWCGKSFVRKSMLRNHITSTHRLAQDSSCFTCKLCHEAFSSANLAVAHMESRHCDESKAESTYSFEMHTVSRLYVCEYCEKHFAEGLVLNRHRESAHVPEKPYSCKYCQLTFLTAAEQTEHKNTHKTEPQNGTDGENNIPIAYLCEFCNRCFLNQTKYTEHLTIHYGPEPYHCRSCNIKFPSLSVVIEHRLTHGNHEPIDEFDFNRPYECHYCSKSFAIEDALVKHIRMHTGEKPFICEQCGKGFSQSSGLNTHKKVHSDLRPYSCPLCPRTFKIKGDRDVHIRKHSGDRPYKCEFCGKAFMTQHVYSQHRKIHTGERPYKCDVCGIAFRRSHVLTVHKRIHTGEKPNICDICGKRYRQKGDMLKHRRAQHGHMALIEKQ